MTEPVLRRGNELQSRIVKSLYPIAVRYNATLPKCFMQYKDYSNSPTWEETLKIQDMRSLSPKDLKSMKIVSDQPIPLCCSLYYYEVNITAKSQCGALKVGFTFNDSEKAKYRHYNKFVGYHSNTGQIRLNDIDPSQADEDRIALGPPFTVGDVIGCGVNFVSNSIFFTKNGMFIFSTTLQTKLMNVVTMPCVMLISPTTALIANFGQRDFSFAIAQHIAQERCTAVTQAIEDKLTADLASVEMQTIVFDYLMRNGYLATANAMARPSIVPRNSGNNKAALNGADSSNALDTNKLPLLESANSKPTSLNLKSQDMSNGINDQDASVTNLPNSKSSPTQPTAPQRLCSLESPMTESEITPTTPEVKPIPSASGSSSVFQPSLPMEPTSEPPQPLPERGENENLECGGGGPWPETLETAKRRIQLVELITQGCYVEAIQRLNHDYAKLVATMPSIIFMLRCRYFIELLFNNIRPPGSASSFSTQSNFATPARTSSISPKPDCKKKGKSLGPQKRPLTCSPTDCSFSGSSSIIQTPAIRRKCEGTNGNMNGNAWSEVGENDDIHLECVPQENGTIAMLQKSKPIIQNGVALKEKRKILTAVPRSCVKSVPLTPVDNDHKVPTQNGVANHDDPLNSIVPNHNSAAVVSNTVAENPSDLDGIVKMGRELRDTARELQAKNVLSINQLNLLQDAFSLIAYENPFESPFADLIHPRHRKILADSVSNAILMNMGKARYPLLELGIGLLEDIVMDGQSASRSGLYSNFSKPSRYRKPHNHASTSSAGSTVTPSHTLSTSFTIPSTSAIYATATAATSSSSRGHRHHHRSATSSLVVTSTTTTTSNTSAVSSGARSPLPLLANFPSPITASSPASSSSHLRHRSSSGRRLRNTIVQSSPRDIQEPSTSTAVGTGGSVDEGSLSEVIVSGLGTGVDWPEEMTVATATVVASTADHELRGTEGGEVEEVLVFSEGGRRTRADRYTPSGSQQLPSTPPPPPPQLVMGGGQNGSGGTDVRAGGSELAGFFHPILFVPH
nr:ran binding protein 9 [Hymenolepis microstoma]